MLDQQQILVFGRSGQVAESLRSRIPGARFVSRVDAPFESPSAVLDILIKEKPKIVINTSAYTQVDQAEDDPEVAMIVNATTPQMIGDWCAENGSRLVHFSTDYVFPGNSKSPYMETDATSPINTYGRTKLEGEKLLLDSGANVTVFRTSWVYSHQGVNFVGKILSRSQQQPQLQVVDDQLGCPNYSEHLAEAALSYLAQTQDRGFQLYNLTSSEPVTWYGFAQEILRIAKIQGVVPASVQVQPVSSSVFFTKARRPEYSVLSSEKLRIRHGIAIPAWRFGIQECMKRMFPSEVMENYGSPKV